MLLSKATYSQSCVCTFYVKVVPGIKAAIMALQAAMLYQLSY